MLISLSEIMNLKDGIRKINVPIELESFSVRGSAYKFQKKSLAELTIKNLRERKISLQVKAEIVLLIPCDRCLEEVSVPIIIDFFKEFDFKQSDSQRTEDLDETSYIIGYDLDVDKLVYEEILIGFPMKVLCMEDCKGICKMCGTNLNHKECGCDRTEFDPRMSVIRDIFNNFKEV